MIRRPALLAAIVGALSACAPETAPTAGADGEVPRAAPQERSASLPAAGKGPAPVAPPAAATALPDDLARLSAAGERRCGWLHNPTPGNWWLTDRDGQWILAVQGGYQAPGMDEMPDMSGTGWEEVNGHYGYGCACMTLSIDPADDRVVRIAEPSPRPLGQCRDDRNLPRP